MRQKTILKTWMIRGFLETLSPVIIGTGKNQGDVDITLIRDEDGNPFIPATSLYGALKSYWGGDQDGWFWGKKTQKGQDQSPNTVIQSGMEPAPDEEISTTENNRNSSQSLLILQDAYLVQETCLVINPKIEVRDGVKINNERGIAEPKGKFDYETLAPGARFHFHLEVNLWEGEDEKKTRSVLNAILTSLIKGEIRVGAMSAKGFGRIRLTNPEGYAFDFSQPKDLIMWLDDPEKHLSNWTGFSQTDIEPISKVCANELVLEAWFSLKTSMLIRKYQETSAGENEEEPDAIHIQSNGKPILPGTSIKGALRARAERILNTLAPEKSRADRMLRVLMGYVNEETKEKMKSRMRVEETHITQESIMELIHSRVKIDRFTGGTMETHLFNFRPLWPKDDEKTVQVKCSIQNPAKWEAGLLMLLLKDLWTGDLPIGGEKSIGRGVLQGISATLDFENNRYSILQEKDRLEIKTSDYSQLETIDMMEGWLTSLHEELQKKEES